MRECSLSPSVLSGPEDFQIARDGMAIQAVSLSILGLIISEPAVVLGD